MRYITASPWRKFFKNKNATLRYALLQLKPFGSVLKDMNEDFSIEKPISFMERPTIFQW